MIVKYDTETKSLQVESKILTKEEFNNLIKEIAEEFDRYVNRELDK